MHGIPQTHGHYMPEASQRVLDLTAGYPYLVQLLCREIVAHKKTQLWRMEIRD